MIPPIPNETFHYCDDPRLEALSFIVTLTYLLFMKRAQAEKNVFFKPNTYIDKIIVLFSLLFANLFINTKLNEIY